MLYGVVKWLNDHPILDGMPYFSSVEDATEYALEHENIGKQTGFNVRYTIIRLRPVAPGKKRLNRRP